MPWIGTAQRVQDALATRYAPQVEQFGIQLAAEGEALVGEASTDVFDARVHVLRIGQGCVAVSHDILIKRDMAFFEEGAACLCLCSLSRDSLYLTPTAPRGHARDMGNVAVMPFETGRREMLLRAGTKQRAVSLSILPGGLVGCTACAEEPGEVFPDEVASPVKADIESLSPLFARDFVTGREAARRCGHAAWLVAEWRRERERAERAAGTRAQALLARQAQAYVATHLGEALTLDTVARDLLTSRTRLCAAFRQEEREGLGAYIRRVRLERARLLLSDCDKSIADIARQIGYPRASSFTVAFEKEFGASPSAWRERSRSV